MRKKFEISVKIQNDLDFEIVINLIIKPQMIIVLNENDGFRKNFRQFFV